jgi:hypothetical protein
MNSASAQKLFILVDVWLLELLFAERMEFYLNVDIIEVFAYLLLVRGTVVEGFELLLVVRSNDLYYYVGL